MHELGLGEFVPYVPEWLAPGLMIVAIGATSYLAGPGWLPHSRCPYCCWCSGRVPLGERIERRVRGRLGRDGRAA